MNPSLFDKIRDEAQALEPSERIQLARDLLDSLKPGDSADAIDQAWKTEAEGRLAAFDAGDVRLVSADDLYRKALAL